MHLTLKKEATKPAAANVLQQQARFDAFVEQYNRERPHQALGMKVPADVYARSSRVYRGLEDLTYPFHDADLHRDPVRPDLLQGPEGESQPRLCRAERGRDAGGRAHLARHLHAATIWATSTTRRAGSNRSTIRSARKCYLCPRNELSPM